MLPGLPPIEIITDPIKEWAWLLPWLDEILLFLMLSSSFLQHIKVVPKIWWYRWNPKKKF